MHILYNLYCFWLKSVMSLLYGWAQVAINQLVTQREVKKISKYLAMQTGWRTALAPVEKQEVERKNCQFMQ